VIGTEEWAKNLKKKSIPKRSTGICSSQILEKAAVKEELDNEHAKIKDFED